MGKYLSRNLNVTPKPPKSVIKHALLPKNGLIRPQNWAEQVKIAQYLKSGCFLVLTW